MALRISAISLAFRQFLPTARNLAILSLVASSVNDFGAGAGGKPPSGSAASHSEKRTASGTSVGEWLVNVESDVVVPMTTGEIVEGLRAGRLSEDSLVWRIGMQDWMSLRDVPQLRLAAGSLTPPPVSARVVSKPPKPQRPEQPRRSTLPLGFPALRDPASVRQPAGLVPVSPSVAPASSSKHLAPVREEESVALAVYDRPAASLTFSDSVRAEWQGSARLVHQGTATARAASPAARKLTPAPVAPAPLAQSRASTPPNSLVPTTAEALNAGHSRAFSERSLVLEGELRAVRATTKRVALWAALGSAALASAFTLWLVHSPAKHGADVTLAAVPIAALPPIQPLPAAREAPRVEAAAAAAPPSPLAVSMAAALAKHPPSARATMKPVLPRAARAKPVATTTPVAAASDAPDPSVASDLPVAPSEPNSGSATANTEPTAPSASDAAASAPTAAPPAAPSVSPSEP